MASVVAAAIALSWLMTASPASARSRSTAQPAAAVPLPQPRPEGAPQRAKANAPAESAGDSGKPGLAKNGPEPGEQGREEAKDGTTSDTKAPPAPQPSACRTALTEEIAIAPSIPPIKGPGACGGDDLVRLEAVVLPDKRRVAVTPAAIMRCTMATTVANWVRSDVAPLAARLGSPIAALDNFASYQCRGRNNIAGAQMSEHGRANALDVQGFRLADGRTIELTDRTQPRDLREEVLHSVCTHFTTVLGPDSDWYHEDHIHLDLAERRSNYRICQWDVLDPLPQVAPLMPAVRPDDAPPRETAEADEAEREGKPAKADSTPHERSDKTVAAPERDDRHGSAAEAEETEPAASPPAPPPAPAKGGKKKRKSRT